MSNPEFTAPDYTTQSAAQYKANLDAAIASASPVTNLGFSYSAGTFTVHGHEGTALASTNPAFVRFQDPDNFGQNKFISVEANQNFIDDPDASNNLFGFPTGVAVDTDVTFYLYAVSNDDMDAVAMMISRDPYASSSPVVSLIGAPDDAVADTGKSFFSLDSLDETLYDTNPCTRLGSFRMQMSASDDWTVQALDATDGIDAGNVVEKEEYELIGTYTASNSASLDMVLDSQYGDFKLVFDSVLAATDNVECYLRTSNDGVATFDAGASDYAYSQKYLRASSETITHSATAAQIQIAEDVNNNAAEGGMYGEVLLADPLNGSLYSPIRSSLYGVDGATPFPAAWEAVGYRTSADRVDAVSVIMSSGNITSGTIRVYGIKRLS